MAEVESEWVDVKTAKSSWVWLWFMRNKSGTSVKCKVIGCGRTLKYCGATTNLSKHLLSKHQKSDPKKKTQQNLTQFTYPMSHNQKLITINRQTLLVVEELLPLRLVEKDSFRGLLKSLNSKFEVSCVETIKTTILDTFEKVKVNLKKINKNEEIHLT